VLQIAEYYNMPELSELCELVIAKTIDRDLCDVIEFALELSNNTLLYRCLDYINGIYDNPLAAMKRCLPAEVFDKIAPKLYGQHKPGISRLPINQYSPVCIPFGYKLVVQSAGKQAGKAALIHRFLYGKWLPAYQDKEFYVNHYTLLSRNTSRGSFDVNGMMLVYPVDSMEQFQQLKDLYKAKIQNLIKRPKLVVVATKIDIPHSQRQVRPEQGLAFAEQINCVYIETSAKKRLNVTEAFNLVIRKCMKKDSKQPQPKKKNNGCTLF